MDNPQGNFDVAWLAGTWDGEGSIAVKQGTGRSSFSPRVSMVNTNPAILNKVCEILDEAGIGYHMSEKGTGGFPGSTKQCWSIVIGTMAGAFKFLSLVGDFLVGKKEQAILLRRFLDSRLRAMGNGDIEKGFVRKGGYGNKQIAYTPEELETLCQIYEANGDQRKSSETIRAAIVQRLPLEYQSDRAEKVLNDEIFKGREKVPAREVEKILKHYGVGMHAGYIARDRMGIKVFKDGLGPWMWVKSSIIGEIVQPTLKEAG